VEPELQPSSRAGSADRRREAGFTLVEMVALLAIFGLLVSVALPGLSSSTSHPKLEALALSAAAIFEADHYAAMRRHADVASIVDARTRTIGSGSSHRALQIPADVSFDTLLAKRCLGTETKSVVVFLPNGMSCGGVVALSRGGVGFDIRVNWLTGGTEIVPRAPS